MLEESRKSGAEVVALEENGSASADDKRRLGIHVVVDPLEDTAVAEEEIFGPILGLRSYDKLEEAVDYINERERPLGLYVFGDDEKAIDYVLDNTNSGGAAVNAAAAQGALVSVGARVSKTAYAHRRPRSRLVARATVASAVIMALRVLESSATPEASTSVASSRTCSQLLVSHDFPLAAGTNFYACPIRSSLRCCREHGRSCFLWCCLGHFVLYLF